MDERSMIRGKSNAETCRLNGWTVGTTLTAGTCDEVHDDTATIEITAIGEREVLAKDATGERVWDLSARDWEAATPVVPDPITMRYVTGNVAYHIEPAGTDADQFRVVRQDEWTKRTSRFDAAWEAIRCFAAWVDTDRRCAALTAAPGRGSKFVHEECAAALHDREELLRAIAECPAYVLRALSTLREWERARDDRSLSAEEYAGFVNRLRVVTSNLEYAIERLPPAPANRTDVEARTGSGSAEHVSVLAATVAGHVACFTEDEFAEIATFPTSEECRAFASGYTSGAGQYGAGSCAAYVLPAQDHEMRASEKDDEWKRAIAAIEACDAAKVVAVESHG